MGMCVVIRSDTYYKKLNVLQRIFAWIRPKKLFHIRRIELTNGGSLSVLITPESIGVKRSAKILKSTPGIKEFETILIEPAFFVVEKLFLDFPNMIVIPDLTSNDYAQTILNMALLGKLFEKSVASLCSKNELSIGLSINKEWQFSAELVNQLADRAKYVTILSTIEPEYFLEDLKIIEQECGMECFISQDINNGLLDCDVVISFGLNETTRLKRDVVIIDVLDSFRNGLLRKVVSGFDIQPLIDWDVNKEGAELFSLIRKNIGFKLFLLFFLVDFSGENTLKVTSDYLNHYWLQSTNKLDILRNDRLLKQINEGFAHNRFFINTICHKGC